jgi:hypothetical protein
MPSKYEKLFDTKARGGGLTAAQIQMIRRDFDHVALQGRAWDKIRRGKSFSRKVILEDHVEIIEINFKTIDAAIAFKKGAPKGSRLHAHRFFRRGSQRDTH